MIRKFGLLTRLHGEDDEGSSKDPRRIISRDAGGVGVIQVRHASSAVTSFIEFGQPAEPRAVGEVRAVEHWSVAEHTRQGVAQLNV